MGLGGFLNDVGDIGKDIGGGLESAGKAVGNFALGNSVVENVSKALNWTYDNGISQPISTALMAGELKGGPFSAHNWARAWHAANHISPAQALFLSPEQTEKAVNSKLKYYKPPDADLPPGFNDLSEAEQQQILKDAGMPAVGNAFIEELRQSNSMFKYSSGVGDFALRWTADPLVLGASTVSKVRRLRNVRPRSGWSSGDIDKIMQRSNMGRLQDFVWANRENPALLNNLAVAKNLGPRFGAIASLLKTPDEVHDFIRVGLGDVDAIGRLQSKNAAAAARIEQETSRNAMLDQMVTRYSAVGGAASERYVKLARQALAEGSRRLSADQALVERYEQIAGKLDPVTGEVLAPGIAHEIDNVASTRWGTAKAARITTRQAGYRARAARGLRAQQAGRATPHDGNVVKTRLYGIGDYFATPYTVVRAFGNARPNGYIRLDGIDKDTVAEVRGHIARIPGISDASRLDMLNQYLKTTTEGERLALLEDIGRIGAAKIAEKHGLSPQAGLDLYKMNRSKLQGEIENLRRYSAAKVDVRMPDGSVARLRADEFATEGGGVRVHPNLVTRMVNDHVLQDLDHMDKVLARNAGSLRAIRSSRFGNLDWITDRAEQLNSLWKFGTLFRLGYIPRVAGDDLAGQVARLGAAAMAMRIGWGVRNKITNVAMWHRPSFFAAAHATAMEGVKFADEQIAKLTPQASKLRRRIANETQVRATDVSRIQARVARAQARVDALTPDLPKARHTAAHNYLKAKQNELARAQARASSRTWPTRQRQLTRIENQLEHLKSARADAKAQADEAAKGFQPVRQGTRRVKLPGGVEAPAAFEGKQGEYYLKRISPDEAVGQIFATNKRLLHGHLMRSFDHGGQVISAAQDPVLHAESWAHAINAQLMQDELSRQAIKGATVAEMADWLEKTAAGRAYLKRLGIGMKLGPKTNGVDRIVVDAERLANGAKADVDEYLPTPEIRLKALEPEGVTPAFLKKAMPQAHRPDVHTGQVGRTQGAFHGAVEQIMASFYRVAASLPAERLSRHPLFNQLYEDHLGRISHQLMQQGAYDTTVAGVERMATTARRLAERDMKKLVFDIAHKSDVTAALRFVSPFMAATTESFQRWARIIADKPQVVGYANIFYNAPVAAGAMQDADGNHITRDGYAYTMTYPTLPDGKLDYDHGKAVKRLVPKNERYIVGRMPKWVVDNPAAKLSLGALLGIEPSSGKFRLSQNSMDIVTQGDPWYNPGMGPIVQIPVNQFVKDKPKAAEVARHLGVLPFGPQSQASAFLLPSTIRNFLTAYDTSDERYQAVKMQIMQRAIFEHDQLGKPMPTAKQIADKTRNYWLFSAGTAFLQPMATQKKDAYQFYRDQYNELRRQDPLTADDQFLQRYGEDYFIFAQSQSKNESGIPATVKAVQLQKEYGDLIDANPELGALIVGPEGDGPFSPEAYSYQLNTPLTPGGAEMQRTKMSADEALEENQRRLGWAKYTSAMDSLNTQLRNRGLTSFSDDGAQDLLATKRGLTKLWQAPLLPDGSENPYYNEAWSKDYSTYDTLKYDRLIPGLERVADSDLADDPNRSDLRTLRTYLAGRKAVVQALAQRAAGGGHSTLAAQSNADLAEDWQRFVDSLVESSVRFGNLHTRYLSRDLGYDGAQAQEQEGAAA
jgi:hypothetical protein